MTHATLRRWQENGGNIARLRRRSGISQEKLAAQVDTTRRHMIRLENGEHLPSGGLRDRIADAIGADRSEIQSADDEDEESEPLHTATVDELVRELFARVGHKED